MCEQKIEQSRET